MPPLLATSSGALYNMTDRWRTLKTTPSVVREGGKIKISLSGGTWAARKERLRPGGLAKSKQIYKEYLLGVLNR